MHKIPWAQDRLSERMVHVSTVKRGKACGACCPSCLAPLIAKKGDVKAHHFAHTNTSVGCEGFLHATAKKLLTQRINDALSGGDAIGIRWRCEECPCPHDGNLLKGIDEVRMEQRLDDGRIRPDIVLYKDGQPRTFLELVVTHKPEPPVHDFARSRSMPLVIFEVHTDTDLTRVSASPVEPSKVLYVNGCACPQCKGCSLRTCTEDNDEVGCIQCGQERMRRQFMDLTDYGHCSLVLPLYRRGVQYDCGCEYRLRYKWHRAFGRRANEWYTELVKEERRLPAKLQPEPEQNGEPV